jgi:hypothetical protein
MRKSLWFTLGFLFVAIGAPNAHADTLYTYTFTDNNPNFPTFANTWTTRPIAAVTAETDIAAANLASYSATGSYWEGMGLSKVILDYAGIGAQDIFSPLGIDLIQADYFALGEYSTPGTYTSSNTGDTLSVSAIQTPEPSTVALMLAGIGFLLVMRKRIGQGLPQAS